MGMEARGMCRRARVLQRPRASTGLCTGRTKLTILRQVPEEVSNTPYLLSKWAVPYPLHCLFVLRVFALAATTSKQPLDEL